VGKTHPKMFFLLVQAVRHMAKQEYTAHQRAIINRYYDNLDAIMLQKVSELVSELYLAEGQAKKDRLWQRVEAAMAKLHIPPAIAEHIMAKRDIQILAKNLQDWLNPKNRRK